MSELIDWRKPNLNDFVQMKSIMDRYKMRQAFVRYDIRIDKYLVFQSHVEGGASITIDDVNDAIDKLIDVKNENI